MTRGKIQLIQARALSAESFLLLALLYIPHPDIVTNIGAAIPPIEAEKNAIGCPTVIPSGGMIAAV